jgi:UDP-N-acetylglucosamine acyltransferase
LKYIHPNARVGNNCDIAPFVYIEEDVEIGDNVWIGPHVTIFKGTRIGSNCKIFPGAVIGGIPQDLKYNGEYTTVEIGDHTTIRECVTVNRGTSITGKTIVGDHVLLMAYVHVAHDCKIGNSCVLSNSTNLAGHVDVGDFVTFGGMTGAHQFSKIGSHSFVTGGTMLRKDVPPFAMVANVPGVFIGINAIGLKRRSFELEDIHLIQDTYRYIYQSGFNTSQALEKIAEELPSNPYIQEITAFIRSSERGIVRGV